MLALAAVATIRVGMIPDVNPSSLIRNAQPLVAYLEKKTGARIELTVPTNYASVVEALAAHQLDFAYLGGFTYVQAHERAGVLPLVQRSTDQKFQSLFITQASSPIHSIADLRGKTFAFGDVNSTSGHLMPDFYLHKYHVASALTQTIFTGSHDATALAVANGKVAAGAVDETVYHKLLAQGVITPKQVRVFWVTPPFCDYVWAASPDLSLAMRKKLTDAYLALDPRIPADKKILDLLRGTRFVRANDAEYAALRRVGVEEGMLK